MWIKYRKQINQWLLSVAISIFVLNVIVACYELAPGYLHRNGGATRGVWMPHFFIVKGDEGNAISRIDSNGYINARDDLADSGYVLFMGNSQSNGIQVDEEKRFISLLNVEFQHDSLDDKVYAYNVSNDGYDFCDLVSGFTAAIEEFPNSRAIVLQINNNWTLEKMQNCTLQRPFSEEMRGDYISTHLSNNQKLLHEIRTLLPFPAYVIEKKLMEIDWNFDNAFWYHGAKATSAQNSHDEDMWNEYEDCLNEVLGFLRQNYSGQIIILELPYISLGGGTLQSTNGVRQELFDKLCPENDITYVNMYDAYCREYEAHHVLPYGFSNTRPGYGHLNEAGHRMIADELYPILGRSME